MEKEEETIKEEQDKKNIKHRVYKIEEGDKVQIWRKDWNNKAYYNVMISQKQYDGTNLTWYRPVTFQKGVELQNKDVIIIRKMFENLRKNPRDKFNPITSYMILEFDKVLNEEQVIDEALGEYEQESLNSYELPF